MQIDGNIPLTFVFTIVSAAIGAGIVWGALRAKVTALEDVAADARRQVSEVGRELADFKLEAAKTFVSANALARLEGRLDEGFKVLRDEMRDQQSTIVTALMARQPPSRRKAED